MKLKPLSSKEEQEDDHEENSHLQCFDTFEGQKKIIDNNSHNKNIQDIENGDILQIDQEIDVSALL
jgi:hypothetical protein